MPRPRAYSYVRFSAAKQAAGDSLRRQTQMAREYAEQHGLELDESLTYQDLGVSAYDKSNLTKGALATFLTAAESGEIPRGSLLLVEQLDRLSRADTSTTLGLLQRIIAADIRIVALNDNGRIYSKDNLNLESLILWILQMYRAHDESKSKSERLRKAWGAKREKQEILTKEGPNWLRAREDRSGFDIIEERVESVRKVFELTIAGFGCVRIAKLANQEKWALPGKGETWHGSLVTRIIKNRAVLGEMQPKINVNKKRIPEGPPRTDYFPRIISDETFALAQAAKATKEKIPRRRDETYRNIFQGLLWCGYCGATMVRKNKSSAKQLGYAQYVCSNRIIKGQPCPSLNGLVLEEAVLRTVYADAAQHLADDTELDTVRQAIALLKEQQRNTKASIERLADAIAASDSPTLIDRLVQAEKTAKNLEQQIAEHERALAALNTQRDDIWVKEQYIADLKRIQDPAEIRFRAELREKLLRIVSRITVHAAEGALLTEYKGAAKVIPRAHEGTGEKYNQLKALYEAAERKKLQ